MTTEPRKSKENESEGALSNEHLSVIQGVILEGSKGKLLSDGSVLSILDKNDGQVDEKKNGEVSDKYLPTLMMRRLGTQVWRIMKLKKDAFKDDCEPGSLLHLTLQKLQEEQECFSLNASNEMGSVAFEVTQTARPIEQPKFGELESRKDFDLDLTGSTSLAANDAKIGDMIGRMDDDLDSKDNSEAAICEVVILEAAPGHMDLVEGAEDMNDDERSVKVLEAEDEIDATCSNEN